MHCIKRKEYFIVPLKKQEHFHVYQLPENNSKEFLKEYTKHMLIATAIRIPAINYLLQE